MVCGVVYVHVPCINALCTMYKHCRIQYESMLGGSYGGESECLNVVFQCVWLCDIVGNLPSIMKMDFSEYYFDFSGFCGSENKYFRTV